MKISVIIPTYNEKENIESAINVLLDVFKQVKDHEMHILVVDGNSPDRTADIVRSMMEKHSNLHLLAKKEKGGLGADYTDAMNYAFGVMGVDSVITFDADLSHDQQIIPEMVRYLAAGYDYVGGTRYRKGGGIPPEWGIHRKFMSYCGNMFVRLLYWGSPITDFTSGYKAITRETYNRIKDVVTIHNGYTFALSTNLEPVRLGLKITDIPYHFKDRTMGHSKLGGEYMKNALIFVLKTRIDDIINSRFGKVFVAGGIGAISQLLSYGALFEPLIESPRLTFLKDQAVVFGFDVFPKLFIATLLSIEVGLTVAFVVNNAWSFNDKKLSGFPLLRGYAKNHAVVAGAIVIQLVIVQILAMMFGTAYLLKYLYQIIGILVGLIWNFYFYQRLIWKTKSFKR